MPAIKNDCSTTTYLCRYKSKAIENGELDLVVLGPVDVLTRPDVDRVNRFESAALDYGQWLVDDNAFTVEIYEFTPTSFGLGNQLDPEDLWRFGNTRRRISVLSWTPAKGVSLDD